MTRVFGRRLCTPIGIESAKPKLPFTSNARWLLESVLVALNDAFDLASAAVDASLIRSLKKLARVGRGGLCARG